MEGFNNKTKSINKINKDLVSKNRYRSHQRKVINDFSDRKGILLFHSVGSGKTITALGIYKQILKVKDIKLLIICPNYIKSSWLRDIDKLSISKKNITIIDYDKAMKFNKNYNEFVTIIDEAHNLQEFMSNAKYTKGINNILKSYKIILLTATPIKHGISDLAYLINFVSKKTLLPYNPDEFREKYMKIKNTKRLLFGNIFPYTPEILTSIILYFNTIQSQLASKIIQLFLPSLIIIFISIFSFYITFESFFELDTDKIQKITKEYISYYQVKENNKNYPKQIELEHGISYNSDQYTILLNYSNKFYEPKLNNIVLDLSAISKDIKDASKNKNSKSKLKINNIMNFYNNYQFSGEMLSNLTAIGNIEDSDKIKELVKFILDNKKENHVIYSKFYNNGIKILESELNKKGVKNTILEDNLSIKSMNKILDDFKFGKINVLLIHPSLTEGYEIHGVRNFHILEPIDDLSTYTQIKGRAYRYNSHAHLPLDQQKLVYHNWYCTISPKKIVEFTAKQYSSYFSFIKKYLLSPRYIIQRLLLDKIPMTPDQFIKEEIRFSIENLEDIKKQLV